MILSRARRFTRIIYYTLLMYLVTHVVVFALSPLWFVRTLHNPESVCTLKRRFGRLLLAIVNKRVTVSGLENAVEGRHYLIVANYPSFHTGFVLMMLFPEASIVVHAFMSRVPVLSRMLKRNGFIYAHRRGFHRTKGTIAAVLERSRSGSIIILPEGKRTPDGRILEFKRGFVHILRHSSLDLLPVTLSGFYRLKPANRPYLDPDTDLRITIHKPINHVTIEAMDDAALRRTVVSSIQGSYTP